MKSTKNNDALMKALAHVQAAASIMGHLTDDFQDPLFGLSSANDEPDFQELQNIADGLQGKLCRLVPKFRLLIYSGAPKGTIYKKTDPEHERLKALTSQITEELKKRAQ